MANALITIEERLYTERGAVGGDGWQEWEVVSRAEETPDVASLLLRPADGRPTLAFRAGQCVSVQVELADGARQIRPDRGALRGDPLDHGEAGCAGRARRPTASSRGICTGMCARATCCGSRPRTAASSWRPTARPCCSPPRASAAPRCWPCWKSWWTRGTRVPSPRARRPLPRHACAARLPRGARRLTPGFHKPLLVRGARFAPPHRQGRPHRRAGRPRHPRLPLRPPALHARGARAAAR